MTNNSSNISIDKSDMVFLDRLRGFSIFLVILGHLGLYWIMIPYSSALGAFLPAFFFISGAVSVGSFQRSSSTQLYFYKRLVGLLIPVYLFVCTVALVAGLIFNYPITAQYFWLWFQLIPNAEAMPFPLGQVWFLHVMVIITALGSVLFKLFGFNPKTYLAVISACIMLSLSALFINTPDWFKFGNHNLFKPLVHFGFFVFGCYWIINRQLFTNFICMLLSITAIVAALATVHFLNLSPDIADHVYNPDGYYVLLSYGFLFLLLALKDTANLILTRIKVFDAILHFGSKHSYGIFIIHTFFIFFSEEVFGWLGVISDPKLAIMKVSFVIGATCLASIPFTAFTNYLSSIINKKITKHV